MPTSPERQPVDRRSVPAQAREGAEGTRERGRDGAREGAREGVRDGARGERYARLVRLAYLTLPPEMHRHRRVLVAHAVAQRALPQGEAARARVLGLVFGRGRRPRHWPGRWPTPGALRPAFPVVWGLRLLPRPGGGRELALNRALAKVSAPARAAFVLRALERLPDFEIRGLLAEAGEDHTDAALRDSHRLDDLVRPEPQDGTPAHGDTEHPVLSPEFDACMLRATPTDPRRRRQRVRVAWVAGGIAVTGAVLLAALGSSTPAPTPVPSSGALAPAALVRAPGKVWADSSRVDFTVWPARGDRRTDRELLARALSGWARTPPGVEVRARGVSTAAPSTPPRLLYAGGVDGRAVVLLHDGQRLVRYSESAPEQDAQELEFSRADESDVTTAAAVALSRSNGRVRYLTAPWITESQSRDLLRPTAPARNVPVSGGVTEPVRVPSAGAGGDCGTWPVLRLRSSAKIVEKHAFLLSDLGALSPVHLTYTPLPSGRNPARQPREATSQAALLSWARTACELRDLRTRGVRAVNTWDFARQPLPENAGTAVWSCTRATTWRGPGDVTLHLRTPARSTTTPARPVAQAKATAACSRFGQHVVAATNWTSKTGRSYLLAAGSREVTRITTRNGTEADANADTDTDTDKAGRTLTVRVKKNASPTVEARTSTGQTLHEVDADGPH